MCFRTLWKNSITSYAGWFTNSLRRRRSVILGLLVTILLLVICIQYNTSDDVGGDGGGGIGGIQNTLIMASDMEDIEQQPRAAESVSSKVRKVNDDVQFFDEQLSNREIRRPQLINANAESQQQQGVGPYVPPRRLVHLDFKGAPPKLAYLQKLFPLIRKFGGTGLLLEWEDMFPWSGKLASLAAGNAYTKADVKEIIKMAAANELEVIPLIQTFGHVEFALKLPDFAHLREVQESPQALCPSYNASTRFVEQMIDQVK